MKIKSSNSIRGVTLVEIAIVLVIIGLLLGGILKGQELINNAKVRSIADRQNSLKVAWFAFIDRFQALPGDYVYAAQYIPGATNGEGNGLITQKNLGCFPAPNWIRIFAMSSMHCKDFGSDPER